jgi:tetratricopeptide (TPR) repeat protein
MNATSEARLDAQHPWPGLRSFSEDDSPYFFGREREIEALLDLVDRSQVTVLYGQSGLGKTSLLRAGLFPRLKPTDRLPVWVRFDHSYAAPPYARQILRALVDAFAANGVEAPAPDEDETLWSYFHRQDADFWGARNRLVVPLIVLDQFEELFTLGSRTPAAQARTEALARELEAQFEQRPPAAVRERLEQHPEDAAAYDLTREAARFVISLREDYLPHLDAWRERMPSMLANRFRLEQMSGTQALEVVRRAGSELVDDDVARAIVAFVASSGGAAATTDDAMAKARVEPAILSVVCDQLNERRIKRGLPKITSELVTGERSGIIGDFYERAFRGIDDSVRDWVEDELLTASGHRDRAALEDARREGIDPAALATLIDRRILHSDERNQVVWVELTHDLLTEPALASRNARQQRRTEAEAAARAEQAATKLRNSRIVTGVFAGLLAVAIVAILWTLHSQNKTEQALEALAKDSTEELEREWLEPGFASGEFVRTTLDNLDASKLLRNDAMRALRVRALAAAAAVHYDRGDEKLCTQYAVEADNLAKVSPKENEAWLLAIAMTHYANGQCLRLRGQLTQAIDRYGNALAIAERLSESDWRQRLQVLSRLGIADAALRGYDHAKAAAELDAVNAAIAAPSSSVTKDEVRSWQVAASAVEAELLTANQRDAMPPLARVNGVLRGLPAATRDQPAWRHRSAVNDIRRSRELKSSGKVADADEVLDGAFESILALLDASSTKHTAWRLTHDDARRARAEILLEWGRQQPAASLLEKAREDLASIIADEPQLVHARWLSADSACRRAQARNLHPEAKRGHLVTCEEAFNALMKDAPNEATALRSWALAQRELARLALEGAGPPDRRSLDEADARLQKAARALAGLGKGSGVAVVHGVAAEVEVTRGEVATARGELSQALLAYERALGHLDAVKADPQHLADRAVGVARPSRRIASLQRRTGARDAASATDRRTYKLLADAQQQDPRNTDVLVEKAWVYRTASTDELELNNIDGSISTLSGAVAAMAEALRIDPLNPALRDDVDNIDAWIRKSLAPAVMSDGTEARRRDLKALEAAIAKAKRIPPPDLKLKPGAMAPIIAGNWEYLSVERTAAEEQQNDEAKDIRELVFDEVQRLKRLDWDALHARTLALSFYDDARLVEMELRNSRGEHGMASMVVDRTGIALRFQGSGVQIHDYNSKHGFTLRRRGQARSYIRFFVHALQSKNSGIFRIVENAGDLTWAPGTPGDARSRIEQYVKPLQISRRPDGQWIAQATVQLGDELYHASLSVSRDGGVRMFEDRRILSDPHLVSERYVNGVRVRQDGTLKLKLAESAREKNWKNAVIIQQQIVADRTQMFPGDAERRAVLPGEYVNLSWYQLFSRDFQGALNSVKAGLAIEPRDMMLQTNRAHALLLLNREAEAFEVYRQYIGKRFDSGDRSWEDVILKDLTDLEKEGVTHPRFADVRALMRSGGTAKGESR